MLSGQEALLHSGYTALAIFGAGLPGLWLRNDLSDRGQTQVLSARMEMVPSLSNRASAGTTLGIWAARVDPCTGFCGGGRQACAHTLACAMHAQLWELAPCHLTVSALGLLKGKG